MLLRVLRTDAHRFFGQYDYPLPYSLILFMGQGKYVGRSLTMRKISLGLKQIKSVTAVYEYDII